MLTHSIRIGAGLRMASVVCFIGLATGAMAITISDTPREGFWSTDGFVLDIARVGDALVVGGEFNYIGPSTGAAAVTDINGLLTHDFPKVEGEVFAVADDAAGGWFVGGSFHSIGGIARTNLAHVLPNGTVNPIDISASGPVYALTRSGTTILAGGAFNTIGNQARSGLAAFTSAGQLTNWNPGTPGTVYALVVASGTVMIGGEFTSVAGQTRRNLAAVDFATGALLPWRPSIVGGSAPGSPRVNALSFGGNTLYVGGAFGRVEWPDGPLTSQVNRFNLAAFSLDSSAPLPWQPATEAEVFALRRVGTSVYIGGAFNTINGTQRRHLGAVGAVNGNVTSWFPGGTSGIVYTLATHTSNLYAGGNFKAVSNEQGYANVIRIPFGSDGVGYGIAGGTNGPVHAIAFQITQMLIGGTFTSGGGPRRQNLAVIDANTGEDLGYDIPANSSVWSLAAAGTTVYVGGGFSAIGGLPRTRLAQIQLDHENPVLNWTASTSGPPNALAVTSSNLLVGGFFSTAGGQPRSRLAAFSRSNGELQSWNPGADGVVLTATLTGLSLFVTGEFDTVAGQSRRRAAALDPGSGALLPWTVVPQHPSGVVSVARVAVAGDTAYLGGFFDGVNGVPRQHIAAVDRITGAVLDWVPPQLNGSVLDLVEIDGHLIITGFFSQVAGESRFGLAATSGVGKPAQLLPWHPPSLFLGFVRLRLFDDTLYVFGIDAVSGPNPEGKVYAFDILPGPPPNPYDINGDGFVNAVDVQLVINAALGISIAPFNADVNGDGSINAVDVQQVINAALGLN
jgi:hypothetical protein